MSAAILRFPVERTKRARLVEAWRIYEAAFREWHEARRREALHWVDLDKLLEDK